MRRSVLTGVDPSGVVADGTVPARTTMNQPSPPSAPAIANGSFLRGYRPLTPGFDEMVNPDGRLRDHWTAFADSLENLGMSEFVHRWDEAKNLLRANGVTYNLHGEPSGLDRPWQLDPIPLVIGQQEAERLSKGLVQRARLLEAILQDLYGPQRLVHEGYLPPEILYANASFLRACHNLPLLGKRFLHLVAVDLGRGPSGEIVVLGHRTQAPAGAGYALENRIVLSRMLPETFRDCNVQRLALFFRTFRDQLRAMAPHNRDNPRTVLLTPGPHNETYFEHAYLARYLGYMLAEGGDLTVRDNRVYLKFLDGLQPVDVILRRLEDDTCDPLELRPDSFLGVPGLVQAIRAGNVAVANAIGSALAESPALLPFLPNLCRVLLGEDLLIPSMPAWWCGDPAQMDHVLAHMDRMVIKGAFPPRRSIPTFGMTLSREARLELADRIAANPYQYVGQEFLPLSTTPVLTPSGVQPRAFVVRTFLSAADPDFILMPGGLTRFAPTGDTTLVSLQKGGGSKDTWILTSGPVSEFTLLKSTTSAVELSRGGSDLPSRAADNLYWLGRYVERTDGMVRLLRGIVTRLVEKPAIGEAPELPVLFKALGHLTQGPTSTIAERADELTADPGDEIYSIVFDPERVGSLAYNLQSIARAAGTVRDRISMDMWRVLSSMQLPPFVPPGSNGAHDPVTLSDILDLLNRGVITMAAFAGLATESMTRGHGWRFLDMGRKVERVLHLIALIRGSLGGASANEVSVLESLLEIADGVMTYRRRYMSTLHIAAVLDLILADESNPRSLVSQLVRLKNDVEQLPRRQGNAIRPAEERIALALVTAVQLADIQKLAQPDEDGCRSQLEDLLAYLEDDIPRLSDAISNHFLSHLQVSRHLMGN
jgi:uncharacterized circularly permuted ATP-grasp superfamily protein/uncharacterized alpha-E superfamily protein